MIDLHYTPDMRVQSRKASLVQPILIAALLGSIATSSLAQNVIIFGTGQNSCARWLSPDQSIYNTGFTWIMGYLSGRNDQLSSKGEKGVVGISTDTDGIIGEIKKICLQQPSRPLWSAASQVYEKLALEGR